MSVTPGIPRHNADYANPSVKRMNPSCRRDQVAGDEHAAEAHVRYGVSGRIVCQALESSGQNNNASARVVIEPTNPFDQNTPRLPPEPIIERRNESSARLPSTSASVRGASGIPIFLNAYPTTPKSSISQTSNVAF